VKTHRLYTYLSLAALTVLAACGGSGPSATESVQQPQMETRERAQAQITGTLLQSVDLHTRTEALAYSRPSAGSVLDYDGVWLPLDANEPGFTGARRVKNIFLWSEDPTKWTLLADGSSSWSFVTTDLNGNAQSALRVAHAIGQTGSPFIMQLFGAEPGPRAPGLFASRLALKQVSGQLGLSWTHQGRTSGTAIGSESNSPRTSLSLTNGAWQTTSQTIPLYEQHTGWSIQAPKTVLSVEATFDLAKMQFEDVTGFKTKQWSSEYVPSTGTPGVQWFETTGTTARTCCSIFNPVYGSMNANNQAVSAGGDLTEVIGTPIQSLGLAVEDSATNLSIWNSLQQIGVAVVDGASVNYAFTAPGTAGSNFVYLDPRSGRFTYRANDITLTNANGFDKLVASKSTDFIANGWRAGMGVWLYLTELPSGAANGGVQGPFVIASVTQKEMTFTSSGQLQLKPAGQWVQIHRIPKLDDRFIIQRNNMIPHYSRVTGVTLPTLAQSTNPDSYQHQSVRVTLAEPLPNDGIHSSISGTNNNLPVYYWSDSDLTVTSKMFTTGVPASSAGTATVVWDWNGVVAAGIGFQCYNGLVYKLSGGPQGNTAFDFAGTPGGVVGRYTTASAWVKRVSGTGTPSLLLMSHSGAVQFTNSSYQRVEWRGPNVNGTSVLRVLVPANTVVYAVLPQVVQAPTNEQASMSSPIVTQASSTYRAPVLASLPMPTAISNGRVAFEYTASNKNTNKHTLFSVYANSSSFFDVYVANGMLNATLNDNTGAPAQVPMPSGTVLVEVVLANGWLTVYANGVAGTSVPVTGSIPMGTQYIGSFAGTRYAQGSFRNLKWFTGVQ